MGHDSGGEESPWPLFVLDVLREFEVTEILESVEGDAGKVRLGACLFREGGQRAYRANEARQFRSPLELIVHWAAISDAPTVGALRAALEQAPFPAAVARLEALARENYAAPDQSALFDALWDAYLNRSTMHGPGRQAWAMLNWICCEQYPRARFRGRRAVRYRWSQSAHGERNHMQVLLLPGSLDADGAEVLHEERQAANFAPTGGDEAGLQEVFRAAGLRTVCTGSWGVDGSNSNTLTAFLP